jgi:hypothetical protein
MCPWWSLPVCYEQDLFAGAQLLRAGVAGAGDSSGARAKGEHIPSSRKLWFWWHFFLVNCTEITWDPVSMLFWPCAIVSGQGICGSSWFVTHSHTPVILIHKMVHSCWLFHIIYFHGDTLWWGDASHRCKVMGWVDIDRFCRYWEGRRETEQCIKGSCKTEVK